MKIDIELIEGKAIPEMNKEELELFLKAWKLTYEQIRDQAEFQLAKVITMAS